MIIMTISELDTCIHSCMLLQSINTCMQFAWESCFHTKSLCRTFFLLSLNIETSLLSSFLLLLLLAPCSSSLWRDSPMSFKMASVKLLATQEGTNRCPCSFFQLMVFLCRFSSGCFLFCFFVVFFYHWHVSFSTATAAIWCHIFAYLLHVFSLYGCFLSFTFHFFCLILLIFSHILQLLLFFFPRYMIIAFISLHQ